jgi:4-amino-4-deoxy-L-arabinose transferase-like glycosyltransferase
MDKPDMTYRLHRYFPNGVILILIVMAFLTYLSGLFVDVTRDASKYAAIAREVFETGDFIHLQVEGEPYIQKPPLMFWLSALSFHVFGISNFAFKLPMLLFSFLGMYSVYRLAKSMYGRNTGIVAALLLGSAQISFLYNMDIHTDTLMQSLVTFALWQLYDFIKTGRNLNWVLGFSGVGLAMLTKGVVGAVVPAFAVAGYLIFNRQIKKLADIRWYMGTGLAFILLIPALKGLYDQFGWEGIRFFFWTNISGRITGEYTSSDRNSLFYMYNLFVLFFPWVLILFVSLFLEFRSVIRRRVKSREWFVFSGIWFFFLVLSFSKSKLPNYIYVLIPLFSVVTAKYLVLALPFRRERLHILFLKLQTVVCIISLILTGILSIWLFPLAHWWQWFIVCTLVGISAYTFIMGHGHLQRLILPSLSLSIALNFCINQHVAPQIFSDQASVKAAGIFNDVSLPGDKLYNYNYPSHEMYFYSKTGAHKIKNDLALFELMKKPGNWVFTTSEVVNRMPDGEFPQPEVSALKHVRINKLNWMYLNPKTREQSYEIYYLLRSTARAE